MCGIYFFTKNSEINIENIKKSMHHRGPDFQRQIDLSHSIIGHNLLSIRDDINLSKQPITIPQSETTAIIIESCSNQK